MGGGSSGGGESVPRAVNSLFIQSTAPRFEPMAWSLNPGMKKKLRTKQTVLWLPDTNSWSFDPALGLPAPSALLVPACNWMLASLRFSPSELALCLLNLTPVRKKAKGHPGGVTDICWDAERQRGRDEERRKMGWPVKLRMRS